MLQRTCTLIALPSTTRASCFLPGSWVDLLIPKHCASGPIIPWQCHQFPESCFSPFHPCLPGASAGKGGDCRCFWRVMAWLAGAQPARCVPVAARHVCWCVLTVLARAPCSAPDWCWACVTLCHAAQSTLMPYHCALKAGLYLSQEGYLDIWPLPSFLGVGLWHTGLSLHSQPSALVTWALLSLLFPCAPASFWDTRDGG